MIGFPPKAQEILTIEDLSDKAFLALALLAAKKLDWEIDEIEEDSITAATKWSFLSWGEMIHIKAAGGFATITSKCGVFQLVDWGKNHDNIIDFLREYNVLWLTANNHELEKRYDQAKVMLEEYREKKK